MKKLVFIISICFLLFNWVFAEEYTYDHTLIDCIDWNDSTWEVFESTKPFKTLKRWIESTISYINSHLNSPWNEDTVSWMLFNIKVACSAKSILDDSIKLDFYWVDYNNELIIEWINENSFYLHDQYFLLSRLAWNIEIKNAKFDNTKYYYIYDYISNLARNQDHPASKWIKISNSYIKIRNNLQIWSEVSNYIIYPNYLKIVFPHYTNWILIDNSIIDVDLNSDYNFKMPARIRNSKINFLNNIWSWAIYNINLIEDWNRNSEVRYLFSNLTSNILDFWWNNVSVESNKFISFLNNKFTNFNQFSIWKDTIYINNFFDNINSVWLSWNKSSYNNVFSSAFEDTLDILNVRKNFNINEIWAKWIGWYFSLNHLSKYFRIDTSSYKLYKEITWNEIPESKDSNYITY